MSEKNKINASIFKAYDIRGIYPKEINKEVVFLIGRALVEYTKSKKVAIGFDGRNSSVELKNSLAKGIMEQGADVIEIGLSSTPMVYFSSWNLEVDSAVMVTASHNPAEYNGLKFCHSNSIPIGEGNGMEEIRSLTLKGNFKNVFKKGKKIKSLEIVEKYQNYVLNFFKKGFPQKKIAVDFANGAGIMEKKIYENFSDNVKTTYLFDKLNGNFPNHEANPLKKETLFDLQKKVLEEKADLGVAYDGDADRVGFVDETGEIVPMDFLSALLAQETLKNNPGALILIDLRSSNAVKEVIEESGGKVNFCRVGHSLIKKQMREEGAIFAGELSGHYFFEENSKAEMATLAVIKVLNLLNETGKTMSQLTKKLRRYSHSGEINFEVKDKKLILKKLEEKYTKGKINFLDGIRIDFPDWWFNVRASNTEPKLRLNLEAKNEELMKEKREEIEKIINEI